MTLQKIEFMYDIPEGYRFVRIGKPLSGEMYLNTPGKVVKASWDYSDYWIIVEKIPEQGQSSHNTKRRKHADLIHAWADGAEIEYYSLDDGCWRPTPTSGPLWQDGTKYRIKPKTIRFRNYINLDGGRIGVSDGSFPPNIKWIGDWQEVEIEEND